MLGVISLVLFGNLPQRGGRVRPGGILPFSANNHFLLVNQYSHMHNSQSDSLWKPPPLLNYFLIVDFVFFNTNL